MSSEPERLFNDFIRKWVSPAMQSHLLDDDANDGERVREAIRIAQRNAYNQGYVKARREAVGTT